MHKREMKAKTRAERAPDKSERPNRLMKNKHGIFTEMITDREGERQTDGGHFRQGE